MPGREGSRCLTRQEQVASYSRALYKYDCCHGYHAEGCRVAPPYESSVSFGHMDLMMLNICHTEDTKNEEANNIIHKLCVRSSTCTTRGSGTSNMEPMSKTLHLT